jgi:hypothetical protein
MSGVSLRRALHRNAPLGLCHCVIGTSCALSGWCLCLATLKSCRRLRVSSAPGQVQMLRRVSQAPPRVLSDGVRPRLGLVQHCPRHVSRDSEVRPFRPLGGWDVRLIDLPVHPRVTSSRFDVEPHVPGGYPWAPLRCAPRGVGC